MQAVGLRSKQRLAHGRTRADVLRQMQKKYPSFKKKYSKRARKYVAEIQDPIYPEPFMVVHDTEIADEVDERENLSGLIVGHHYSQ